jgi:hypothetical protein
MDRPDERELLRMHLAGRDTPCPSCGYNLRDAAGDRCPECAHPVALGIVRPGPAAALTWFLLLAFGWVFTAGAMNSVRNAERVRLEVANAQQWGYSSSRTLILAAPSGASAPTPFPASGFWQTARGIVPAMMWMSMFWALVLTIGAGIGLLLMARRRARPLTPAGDQRLVRLACGLFSIYATWHLLLFVVDFI